MIEKKALLFEGVGFYEQEDIAQALSGLGYKVLRRGLYSVENLPTEQDFISAQVILLRGPWTISIEEKIWVKLLARTLFKILQPLLLKGGFDADQKILGIGRGALIMLELALAGNINLDQVEWQSSLQEIGPWIPIWIVDREAVLNGHVMGRGVPNIRAADFPDLEPWLKSDQAILGWHKERRLYYSLVDIFAYADRSQMVNFGFEDLSKVPVQTEVLKMLLENKI